MKFLSLMPLAVLLLQTGVNPSQQQKSTGSIEGTITRAGSSQPILGARVTVTRRPVAAPGTNTVSAAALPPGAVIVNTPGAIPPAITDDKGKFVVPELVDGAYTVQVQANGYIQQFYTGTAVSTSLVNVTGGQLTKDINVAMKPAANIGGRVRDTSDQPLINVQVQLLRYAYDFQGQRSYQAVGTTTTDDHGEYRMYWVTPGRYYLLAGKASVGSGPYDALIEADLGRGAPNGTEVPAVKGYAFYPGVQDIANARVIDLQSGADLQSVDFALDTRTRTFKIRGKLVDSRTGQAPPRATVNAAPQVPGANASDGIYLGPDGPSQNYNAKTGIFEIRDLLPGTYSLIARVMDAPVPGRPGPVPQSSGMLPVTITSSDVDGLTLQVVPAGAIPGRVRFDGQLPGQMTIDRLQVRLVPIGVSNSLPAILSRTLYQNVQGNVAADGTFRLVNVTPGDYRLDFGGFPISVSGAGATQFFGSLQTANAYIKDARLDGVDVMSEPAHFSGSTNNGLEIVLALGSGRIEVTTTDARMQPVAGGRVVAVPERARFRTDLFRSLSIDQNGRSAFPNLPPGDYKIFAWESIEDNGWFDADLLARNEGRASSVHVSESSTQSVNVQIIPAEGKRQ